MNKKGMESGIYIIKNLINNKIYIGSAVNIEKRLCEHIYALKKGYHGNIHLQRAWDKNNGDFFSFKKYLNCEIKNLIFYEQHVIDDSIKKYGRLNIYNICLIAGSTLGKFHSKETKMKIGLKSKGRWLGRHHTEETKEKIRQGNLGKIISKETRKKQSEVSMGKSGYWIGKKRPPFSKEWRENISEANKGKKWTIEQREKFRISRMGIPSLIKGKTYEEIYGDRAEIERRKRRHLHKTYTTRRK